MSEDSAYVQKLINKMNKKAGSSVAFNLEKEDSYSSVKNWIPTGSRLLDSIVAIGCYSHSPLGIPVGRVTEIAGLEGAGKSYLALQIAANAQKMGIIPIYFDCEYTTEKKFIERAGCDLKHFVIVNPETVESVFSYIEDCLAESNEERKFLFIWDSLAVTPCEEDLKSTFDPQSSIAMKARVLSKGVRKITASLSKCESTFLILNQLRMNLGQNPYAMKVDPYTVPGGKSLPYLYSLRIWLTLKKGANSFIYSKEDLDNEDGDNEDSKSKKNENKRKIGSRIKAFIKKDKFGTEGRSCEFLIVWGGDEGAYILDEESWLDALKEADKIRQAGGWTFLKVDGEDEVKFQKSQWKEKLQDEEFKTKVLKVLDEAMIS